jgi:hypothetical protein
MQRRKLNEDEQLKDDCGNQVVYAAANILYRWNQ